MNRSLSLLIKPASGKCNLRCKYCFYHDLAKVKNHKDYGMMEEETLEQIVIKAFEYADDMITFGFQGGEPTLRGLDFFSSLIGLVKKYNRNHINVRYSIQTNGILIDDKWAEFFAENRFLVGLSLDGNRDIHDMHRIDANGEGTYKRVIATTKLLKKHGVDFNILCVVTKALARHGAKVYNSLKSQGFRYLQFIPCMDSIDESSIKSPYSLSPDYYGRFLLSIFDAWYQDMQKGEYISIRMFDNILKMLLGYSPESCDMRGVCSKGTVFEADGSMYPCDFYVMDEWNLGNIHVDCFEDMLNSDKANQFVEISKHILNDCSSCEFYNICRSGCRRYKEPIVQGKPLENYFCKSYKIFYSKALPRFYQIARGF